MVKVLVLIFFLITILLSCASAPKSTQSAQMMPHPQQSIALSDKENQPLNLDSAVSTGAEYLSGKLSIHTKIAFVSMQSPAKNLSEYVIDTMIIHLVNKDKFFVIEREELPALQKEQLYQASGEVSDETAVSIGHQLGVQVIITGSLMETGSRYSLRLKAIDVETAQILGTRIYPVERDQTLIALLTPPPPLAKPKEEVPPPKNIPPQTVINGDINITTNNNTTINGDVYVNKPDLFDPDEWF
ncbi:MAG: CsgG/HfaB family protein [Treponema sp.]|jgi:TolB-like protein|nr:CsgG/HfaB family protein [Treponema sp.]